MSRRTKAPKGKADAKQSLSGESPKSEGSRVRDLEELLAEAIKREAEAREQQAATSEILGLIGASPMDAQPVFDGIARSGVRVCGAQSLTLFVVDGDTLRVAATHGVPAERVERFRTQFPVPVGAENHVTQVLRERRIFHLVDIEHNPAATPQHVENARLGGYRTRLMIPLLRGDTGLGVIAVTHQSPAPFPDQQIALLKTFADQAVIAIENVRLFTELEARNSDLTEALEQQTATSEILRVISSSPTELQAVYDVILERITRLCEADIAALFLYDGECLSTAESRGTTPRYAEHLRHSRPRPSRETPTRLAALERRPVHVTDLLDDPQFAPHPLDLYRDENVRTVLSVPMLQEERLIGVLTTWRREVRPFADQQVTLLQTFASQAVIAVENVRLFTELQASNRELTTALDQQTATSEILRAISASPTDVQPVFDTIVANAVRLCGAQFGTLIRFDGHFLYLAAHHKLNPEALEFLTEAYPRPLDTHPLFARAIRERRVVQVADVMAEPDVPSTSVTAGRMLGYRGQIVVPIISEGVSVGTLSLGRVEPGLFSERQIELLKTFADQAVIAIENARLLTQLHARTAELTQSVGELRALGEVGQAISSTLDLQTVLRTIVARATQLAGADAGVIYEYDAGREVFEPRATEHLEPEIVEVLVTAPVRKGEGATGQLALSPEAVHLPDLQLDSLPSLHHARGAFVRAGYRALLAVPLLREDHLIGGLTVVRKRPGEFPRETIELLRTFATQSALAIQNARLFREIEDKGRQLEAASRHKSEFLANMSHELRTPLNAIIGFSEVLAEHMFGELNEKQDEYLKDIYASGQHLLSLINDILDLSKIEAGRMELEPADFDLPSAIDNALTLVRERAGRHGIMLGRAIDEGVGTIRADERKVKQVLLNLLSNALKFTPEGGRIDVRAAASDGMVEVSVADTGVGIAPEDQEAVFEEFRQVGTADKKVEGTGLGLALSRKFIELHGGRIWVKSEVDHGSTFTFTLPFRR